MCGDDVGFIGSPLMRTLPGQDEIDAWGTLSFGYLSLRS